MITTRAYIQHSIVNNQDRNWKASCRIASQRVTKYYLLGIRIYTKKEDIK